MYSHNTRRTVASRACPGVSFTIRRISYGRRNAIAARLKTGSPRGDAQAEVCAAVDLMQALMEAMLLDVTGLEVDGQPFVASLGADERAAAIEQFLDTAPEALVEEISAAVLAGLRLDGDAEKNSASPSGSPPARTEGGSTA
jgi:hypothetical protein